MPASTYATNALPRFDERQLEATLARIRTITHLMDSRFTLPGTKLRIGLDAVIGLVPVIGDVAGQLVSVYLITEARRLGASNVLIARMFANVMADAVVGSIPLVGDVFDAWFKANARNLALLDGHLERINLKRK